MERVILIVLIAAAACCSAAKHVFVSEELRYSHAESYCRRNYTDLSPLTNDMEQRVFRETVQENRSGWIGLHWDPTTLKWRWSGGTEHDNQKWTNKVPYIYDRVYWTSEGWQISAGHLERSFFCLNLIVVQEQKTWEEALDHCTHMDRNLTSLLSETEKLMATKEIQDSGVTQRVWTGLRFLGDGWLWVNGDPLQYQAWSPGGDQELHCPALMRCGALNKQGEWERRDCEEKLDFICA